MQDNDRELEGILVNLSRCLKAITGCAALGAALLRL